ncbi:MAG TPA: FISUMP domain-containing protein [Puia sp.]|jgi:uncharacterized protein (TIGR02145 family)
MYPVKNSISLFAFMIVAISASAQQTGRIKDVRDGKTYKSVKIGRQTWMAQDLNFYTKTGSWCFENDSSSCDKSGRRLYTPIAAAEACPAGWHLPNADEWMELVNFLGGPAVAGGKLKAKTGWNASDSAASGSSGFSALPGGYRNYGGVFGGAGTEGYWWSASTLGRGEWYFSMRYDDNAIRKYGSNHKESGYSIRCVKN